MLDFAQVGVLLEWGDRNYQEMKAEMGQFSNRDIRGFGKVNAGME